VQIFIWANIINQIYTSHHQTYLSRIFGVCGLKKFKKLNEHKPDTKRDIVNALIKRTGWFIPALINESGQYMAVFVAITRNAFNSNEKI